MRALLTKHETGSEEPSSGENLTTISSCLGQIHLIHIDILYMICSINTTGATICFHWAQKLLVHRSQRLTAGICMAYSQVSASIRRHTSTVCCVRCPTLIFTDVSFSLNISLSVCLLLISEFLCFSFTTPLPFPFLSLISAGLNYPAWHRPATTHSLQVCRK